MYTNPVYTPVGLWTGLPITLFSLGYFLDGTADCCFLAAAFDGVTGALDAETLEVFDFISLFVDDQKTESGQSRMLAVADLFSAVNWLTNVCGPFSIQKSVRFHSHWNITLQFPIVPNFNM